MRVWQMKGREVACGLVVRDGRVGEIFLPSYCVTCKGALTVGANGR